MEEQYLNLGKRLLDEGVWIENKRTGTRCLTLINADFEYDTSRGYLPLVTTRKAFWKPAISEMLGYLKGYDSAADFRGIGCNTWNANANENKAWLANPNRKGTDDMGRVYGVQGREWQRPDGGTVDQLAKIYSNLKKGIDDRGEILTFHNPGELDLGCLRSCMHTHTFSLIQGTLHLTSYQRSIDVPLGLVFNMPQTVMLLRLMAHITGHRPGRVFHKMINCHIYENQLDLFREQMKRKPFDPPKLEISKDIETLEDVETWVTADNFDVVGYEYHPPIKYPFSV